MRHLTVPRSVYQERFSCIFHLIPSYDNRLLKKYICGNFRGKLECECLVTNFFGSLSDARSDSISFALERKQTKVGKSKIFWFKYALSNQTSKFECEEHQLPSLRSLHRQCLVRNKNYSFQTSFYPYPPS